MIEFKVFQNGNNIGMWTAAKVELAMNDKNNTSVERKDDSMVIYDERDEWIISDYYKTTTKEPKMLTMKELYSRKNEIVNIFKESGMTEENTVGDKVYTNIVYITYKDSGQWTYELRQPIIEDVLNRIRTKNNFPEKTFLPYGKTQLEAAIKAGDIQKEKNCRNITAVVDRNIEEVLGSRYGHLIPLQKELFDIVNKIKVINNAMKELSEMTYDDINVDVLDHTIVADEYDLDISNI